MLVLLVNREDNQDKHKPPALIHTSPCPSTWEKPSRCKPWPSFTDPAVVSLTQAGQQPSFSPPAILVVETARPLPIQTSLHERKLSMTSNTHPDPFPTLPPPHACMVNLNHTKIIPSILLGICTLSQLYQYRLSVSCITARAKWAVGAHSFDPLAAFHG